MDGLSKAVAQAATASRDYKAFVDCFVLSGLSRSKSPTRGRKQKAELTSLPTRGPRPKLGNKFFSTSKKGKDAAFSTRKGGGKCTND